MLFQTVETHDRVRLLLRERKKEATLSINFAAFGFASTHKIKQPQWSGINEAEGSVWAYVKSLEDERRYPLKILEPKADARKAAESKFNLLENRFQQVA